MTMWLITMNPKEMYKEKVGVDPDLTSVAGLRKFNEFQEILIKYDEEYIRRVFKSALAAEIIVESIKREVWKYEVEEVSSGVLVNHLSEINDKIGGEDYPAYMKKLLPKQAEKFIEKYGTSRSRYILHALERHNFKKYKPDGFLTFNFVESWMVNQKRMV